jgi:glycerophosphoryl diester phosphodiesterase
MSGRVLLSWFLLAITLCSCFPYEKDQLDILEKKVIRIGHGGMGFARWLPFNPYPVNSFISVQKAMEDYGADGVEVDVQMTADGQFALYHDLQLDSKTGIAGCVSDYKLAVLKETPYQLGFPFDCFQEETIASLNDLVKYLKTRPNFPLLQLDIRNHSVCVEDNYLWEREMLQKLIAYLQREKVPAERVYLITTSMELALLASKKGAYRVSFEIYQEPEEAIEWAVANGISYLTVKPDLLTREISALAHQSGIRIITFGGNSRSGNRELLEKNPDFIQTNNLGALNSLLDIKN